MAAGSSRPAAPHHVARYGLATALGIAALAATHALVGPLAGLFFSIPLIAVVLSGMSGSIATALVTTLTCIVGILFWFVWSAAGPPVGHTVETYRFIGFVATAVLASFVSGAGASAYRRERLARREADAARDRAERATEVARTVSKVQEQILSIVAHDLRTPLAAVRLTSDLLLTRRDLQSSARQSVMRIASSAARMAYMIADLVDYGRIRRGRPLPIEAMPVDVVELCGRAISELRAAHPDRQIALQSPGSLTIDADPQRLLQVLSNLVGNALQHGPPATPVTVSVRPAPDALTVTVHNQGAIPGDALPRIFEPFERGDGNRARERAGSVGLGLFIVREIVALHGGKVSVTSTPGEGTTFTVTLPATKPGARTTMASRPELTSR